MLNVIVGILLTILLKPHKQLQEWINTTLTQVFERRGLPKWVTANLICYIRTTLILPTLFFHSKGWSLVSTLLIITNYILTIVGSIVARHWLKKRDLDDLCLVLDTDSNTVKRRKRDFSTFLDVTLDKLYVVPLWIFLLSHFQSNMLITMVCWPLIFIETASGFAHIMHHYTAVGKKAPGGIVLDSSTSTTTANKSSDVCKTKQTLEMFGSAFLIIPWTYYLGLLLLAVSIPLGLDSVRRQVHRRIIYVTCDESPLNEANIIFLQQARSLGSKLIVGIESKSKDGTDYEQRRREVLLLPCVDAVVDAAPSLADINLAWLNESGVDKLVLKNKEKGQISSTMLKSNDVFTI